MGVCSDKRSELKRSNTNSSQFSDQLNKISRHPSFQTNNDNSITDEQNRNKNKNSSFKENPTLKKKIKKSILIKQTQSISLFQEEYIAFPKGEHFYQLKKDSNIVNTTERDSLSEKVELFFSLDNVCNPMEKYSFSISIINNKNIDIPTFLGNLENASGEKIEFGGSF